MQLLMSLGRIPTCLLQPMQTRWPVQSLCHSMTQRIREKTWLPLLPGSHAHLHSQMQGDSKAAYSLVHEQQLHDGHEQQQCLSCCLTASVIVGLSSNAEECHTWTPE